MIKIPISGGPHSGKTTLMHALRESYPEAHFVDEPAERVIVEQIELEQETEGYKAILPTENYAAFSPLVRSEALRLEGLVPSDAKLIFQDRSLIDNVAYDLLNGLQPPSAMERYIKAARYTMAFFCEPVGEYKPTAVRRETPEQARRTHEYLAEAYDTSGLQVVHLPAVPVRERVSIIREVVSNISLVT